MTKAPYLIPVLAVTALFLIRAEFRNQRQQIYILKPLSTLLVIAVALLSFLEPSRNLTYSVGVLVGLLLSFGGDIALMLKEKPKSFMVGLALFLLAHVAYTVVFWMLGRFSAWDIVSAVILLAAGIILYRLFKPNLGKMRIPVIVYIVVISLMVNRAFSAFASPVFSNAQAWMISLGAVLFYVSDVILAAARFWKPWPYHRISLAFYYAGQLLIALAASYFA